MRQKAMHEIDINKSRGKARLLSFSFTGIPEILRGKLSSFPPLPLIIITAVPVTKRFPMETRIAECARIIGTDKFVPRAMDSSSFSPARRGDM
jgi:hypothetical protein